MVPGNPKLGSGLALIPRLISSGFVVYFGIIVIRGRTVKGPRGTLFYMGPIFGSFCVYCWKKILILCCYV